MVNSIKVEKDKQIKVENKKLVDRLMKAEPSIKFNFK
jgi:hypothetical protein